ncbi:MAG: hypothetical protein EOP62_07620 [Sphingomonadales bacterium]|nr:MAG: hypothetical protein EOP62_07620 [Sphingomonadales bacterium]
MLRYMLLPALLLTAGAAAAQDAPKPKEVSIPLVGGSSVRTFEASRNGDGVHVQDFRGNWYLVRFFSRCFDVDFASTIGFKSFSSMSLDRGDTILAGREQCRISSIVRSGPPPKKVKKPKRS